VTRRRPVRVLPEFFARLDEQLPAERGPSGEPTTAEFAATDLLDIVEVFATQGDELPPTFPDRTDYRAIVHRCHVVHAAFLHARLSPHDGAAELMEISLDLPGLEDPEDEDGRD
jgi:hypothetical protein